MVRPVITRSEVEVALTEDVIRTIRMIFFAMAASIIVFTAVVIWYAATVNQRDSSVEQADRMDMLTFAVIVVFLLLTTIGNTLASTTLSLPRMMARISQQGEIGLVALAPMSPAQQLIAAVRIRFIIRLAFYEGAALFGLVVAFVMAVQGRLALDGASVVNFLPAASALLFVFRNLPNRERILDDCEPVLQS